MCVWAELDDNILITIAIKTTIDTDIMVAGGKAALQACALLNNRVGRHTDGLAFCQVDSLLLHQNCDWSVQHKSTQALKVHQLA